LHARHRYAAAASGGDHGHLYRIDVTVAGPLDANDAVIDLGLLDTVLTAEITTPLSGRHLNEVVPAFASGERQPTCEAVASWCFDRVRAALPAPVRVVRVRVAEDVSLWAECIGDE
jgi:6-pyruvoyl-tetrahydropterin synthase